MSQAKLKSYVITGVVALVAVAVANRVQVTKKLING